MDEQILSANSAFYDAHENRDIVAMSDVWEHSQRVSCIHPGWPILRGWDAVEESWQQIFRGGQRNQFIVTNLTIASEAGVAWVSLDENLVFGASTTTIAATNIFVLGGGGWKLVAHQGSPVAPMMRQ